MDGMLMGDLHIWWRSIRRLSVEINGEGEKCKVYLDGGDKLSIWSIWTVEIIYLDYLDGVKCKVYLDGGDKLSI